MELATGGRVAAQLFPRIGAHSAPAVIDGHRTLGEADFMSGATEDRYPDHFGLAHGITGGGDDLARAMVADRLATLPRHRSCWGTTSWPTPTFWPSSWATCDRLISPQAPGFGPEPALSCQRDGHGYEPWSRRAASKKRRNRHGLRGSST
ncbi:hypothetical protein [Streptomyces sp. NPDC001165]|uniref:hypothetical protein n=1 Tax=Streptomyces sp. NPDC001165 TaxID=3364546 RepID=UPI003691D76B